MVRSIAGPASRAVLWALAGAAGVVVLMLLGTASASADAPATPEEADGSVTGLVDDLTGGALKPTTDSLAPVTESVVAPIERATAPVTEPVADAVRETATPVTDTVHEAVRPVTEPVREAQRQAVAPATSAVAETLAPAGRAVGSVVDQVGERVVRPATEPLAPAGSAVGTERVPGTDRGSEEVRTGSGVTLDGPPAVPDVDDRDAAVPHTIDPPDRPAGALALRGATADDGTGPASASTAVDVSDLDFGTAGDGTARYGIDTPSHAPATAAAPNAAVSLDGALTHRLDHIATLSPGDSDEATQHHVRPDVSPG